MRKTPLLLAAACLLSAASANAQLEHHYNLNGNGTDSVSGSNGTIVGSASFTTVAGMLTTTNGAAATTGGYLNLPSSAGATITGDFSIEFYAIQNGSEDQNTTVFSLSASTTNFAIFKPNFGGQGARINFEQPGVNGGAQSQVGPGGTTSILAPFGGENQIVITYSVSTGALSLFKNGAAVTTTGTFGAGFNFSSVAGGVGGINGGDPFNDLSFNGSTDDFRIYGNALTAAQVSSLNTLGANATDAQIAGVDGILAVPEPSTWMVLLCGLGALLGLPLLRRSSV